MHAPLDFGTSIKNILDDILCSYHKVENVFLGLEAFSNFIIKYLNANFIILPTNL